MSKFAFGIALCVLLPAMFILALMIRNQNPEFQAEQAKLRTERAQRAQLEKQTNEIELESIRNSPAFQKQIAQMILSKQFPGLCGGSPEIARRSDGTIYGQCMGYIYLVDVKAGFAMRIN